MESNREIYELAIRLRAIGEFQNDQVANNTNTGTLLLKASKWLEKLAERTCCHGFIGCRGGSKCTSDHA